MPKIRSCRAWSGGLADKVFPLHSPGSQMGVGPNLSSPAFHPAPYRMHSPRYRCNERLRKVTKSTVEIKIDQWEHTKLRSLFTIKEVINKEKKQQREENLCTIHNR